MLNTLVRTLVYFTNDNLLAWKKDWVLPVSLTERLAACSAHCFWLWGGSQSVLTTSTRSALPQTFRPCDQCVTITNHLLTPALAEVNMWKKAAAWAGHSGGRYVSFLVCRVHRIGRNFQCLFGTKGEKRGKQKEPELFLCGNMLLLSTLYYQVYFKQLGKKGNSTARLCVISVHSIWCGLH